MRRCRHALLALVLLAAPAAAEPAVLRTQVIVTGTVVTLGDLFEHAGPRAAQVLGAAPLPGQRWMLEAPQLSLIARDFGVAWQPLSPAERAVVERPGRALRREQVADALLPELQALGARPELEVELTGFTPPFLPQEAPEPRLAFEGLAHDPAGHRFTATMLVVAEGMPPFRQRIAGRLAAMRSVVVAARALKADTVIGPADVTLLRLPTEGLPPGLVEAPEALVGARVKRAVAADRPLSASDVAVVTTLRQGMPVMLQHEVPGLTIAAQGRALEDGTLGAVVPVLNLATGTVVMAQVLGPGRVRPLGPALAQPNRPPR
ncbi:flagellar basal body P-ring formation chaperone FlgA [Roseicella aquatilis]|uniref:Flagellar basal body P-ring formation protein FlgA n=1 Tax=Roseicella aquatilis TaxID=2527868 RepID=A0A4R4D3N3_9PROT|nr:flagellar basal body P-ring formation chaperone FlgA [Roseicella aquatilis]TCZ53664.1 flagellar basal body P-ring formation protein FlgA [Roseicella aquatilis]